jgi:hypothetical protein
MNTSTDLLRLDTTKNLSRFGSFCFGALFRIGLHSPSLVYQCAFLLFFQPTLLMFFHSLRQLCFMGI